MYLRIAFKLKARSSPVYFSKLSNVQKQSNPIIYPDTLELGDIPVPSWRGPPEGSRTCRNALHATTSGSGCEKVSERMDSCVDVWYMRGAKPKRVDPNQVILSEQLGCRMP